MWQELSKLVLCCALLNPVSLEFSKVPVDNDDTKTVVDHGTEVIDQFIAKEALDKNAVEYADGRKMVYGDINGDSIDDISVIYTLESFNGGNLYIRYLAVFTGSKTGEFEYLTHEEIGGKNDRAVHLESVTNGKINFKIWSYLPKDGSCCPSKEGKIYIILEGKKLVEKPNMTITPRRS